MADDKYTFPVTDVPVSNYDGLNYSNSDDVREQFTIVPSSFTPFEHLTVSPMYAEEWHVRPPAYDIYANYPAIVPPYEQVNKVDDPRDYPYGQYLTTTNLLPQDERKIDLFCNSKSSALGYINSTFVMNDIAYRENMTRILKKKLARRFRHECNDTFSPYYSF